MNIYQSIAAIMSDVDAIGKDKRNQSQGFNFRGIDDVYNSLHPLLAKHGVFTVPQVLEDRTEDRQTKSGGNLIYRVLRIKYTFFAADGSSIDAIVIGEGMDSGDKAANKAMSIAHKYAFFQVFSIPTEEVAKSDPDNYTPEPSSPAATKDAAHELQNILLVGVAEGHITEAQAKATIDKANKLDGEGIGRLIAASISKLERLRYEAKQPKDQPDIGDQVY